MVDPADPDGALHALQKAVWGIALNKAALVSVVEDPRNSFHKLIVPQAPRSELREAIPWELKDQLSLDMKEAEFDFEMLRSVVEKGIKKYEIGVAVTPKGAITQHLSLLQKVGVNPARLIQAPMALGAVLKLSKPDADETVAVLEMGHSRTELSIFQGGVLQFSRRLPVSGGDFTRALLVPMRAGEEVVTLSAEEAERVKGAYGLCQEEALSLSRLSIRPSHVLPLIRPVAERLSSEIERSFIFYQGKSSGGRVAKLQLYGGGAALKGLEAFLSDSLGMDVESRNPFATLLVNSSIQGVVQETPSAFTLALGAALSSEGEINLLPQELKEKTKQLLWRATFKGVSTALALSLFFLYIGMRIELSNLNKKIAVTKLELSALKPAFEEAKEKAFLGDLLTREPYWEDFFRELSHILPEQAYLESLTLEHGRLSLTGKIVAGKEDAERLLSNLLYTMEKGLFHNASLLETEKLGKGEGSSFKIQAELDR